MNKSPAFQFYPDKWQSHTKRLTDLAYRVFHELMCWMWQSSPDQCSVDTDPEAVAAAVAMPSDSVRIAMADIQNKHAPLLKVENGRYILNGLRKEALKQADRRHKATESANQRWGERTQCERNANAYKTQCSSSSSVFPIPSPTPIPATPRKESSSGKPDTPPGFDEIWKLYPDKAGKQNACAAYLKWRKAGDTPEEILAGLHRYIAYVEARRSNGFPDLHWQNGQTWFRGRGWKNEYTVEKKSEYKSIIPEE